MDTVVASTWNGLGVLWRVLLIASPIAFVAWAVIKGRRADMNALEKGKLETEARADTSASPIGRGAPPIG